jgi:hypothetical protein
MASSLAWFSAILACLSCSYALQLSADAMVGTKPT